MPRDLPPRPLYTLTVWCSIPEGKLLYHFFDISLQLRILEKPLIFKNFIVKYFKINFNKIYIETVTRSKTFSS